MASSSLYWLVSCFCFVFVFIFVFNVLGQPSSFFLDGCVASRRRSGEHSVAPACCGECSVAPTPPWLGAEILKVTSQVCHPRKQDSKEMHGGALAWVDLLEIMLLSTAPPHKDHQLFRKLTSFFESCQDREEIGASTLLK